MLHGQPRGPLVHDDALSRVKVTPLGIGLVVGEMKGADGQDGPHDVIAAQTDADHGGPPELADALVDGESLPCQNGEVVEQFQLQER